MEEKRKKGEQQQQHGPAVGARLYFNYTAGCARASSNLVGPLSLSHSLSLSFSSRAIVRSPLHYTPWPQSVSSGFAGNPWYTTETRRNKRRRRTAVYGPPLQPTLQPLSSRCTASDRFSYSLSLPFRNENFYAREKGKERNSFRRKIETEGRGIVKVDDESSLDPFEISKIKFLYQINRIYLAFSFKRIPSIPFFCQNFNRINNDVASMNKSSLQTSRSNPRFYANFQISI